MREAFTAFNDLVFVRLAERGHGDVRAAHGAVFQYLDETGTTVSVLAERAQITKQAMAELVLYLEARGYLVRKPDPGRRDDGPTDRFPYRASFRRLVDLVRSRPGRWIRRREFVS